MLNKLELAIQHISKSPVDNGRLEMITVRPSVGERKILTEGVLDQTIGLVGDNWGDRGSRSTADGSSDPEEQLTLINARVVAAIAGPRSRWPLAGDQIVVDLDLSHENLPPGKRLSIGSAIVEISAKPHTGCAKFAGRFGHDALRFVSTKQAMAMRLRGANARIIQSGTIKVGDTIRKVA